ncbi:VOC family protein [Paenibacillus arenilitoris]|uniref:VOC family protein n=1 Tax=Paenibacillus arenilitoris TaxID=2772299 RepID=A0A927H5X8_9BACL|nr:VOC family protein [Paenibacillus arenilitoris]MBD2869941.1 VOC family protein [Paenibacillus arenilitoris]
MKRIIIDYIGGNEMTVKSLGTVFIRVSRLEPALAFYSEALGLKLRDVERWEDGRGANYLISEQSPTPLLTLIEQPDMEPLRHPAFNLYCEGALAFYDRLTAQGVKVGRVNRWSSEWNDHIDFDVYDPDGNPINLIEWRRRDDL